MDERDTTSEQQAFRGVEVPVSNGERGALPGDGLRQLIETWDDLFLAIDSDGVLVHANLAARRGLGAELQDMAGRKLSSWVAPEHHDRLAHALSEVTDGRVGQFSGRLLASDGARLPVVARLAGGGWDGREALFMQARVVPGPGPDGGRPLSDLAEDAPWWQRLRLPLLLVQHGLVAGASRGLLGLLGREAGEVAAIPAERVCRSDEGQAQSDPGRHSWRLLTADGAEIPARGLTLQVMWRGAAARLILLEPAGRLPLEFLQDGTASLAFLHLTFDSDRPSGWRLDFASRSLGRLWGLAEGAFLEDWLARVHPGDLARVTDLLERAGLGAESASSLEDTIHAFNPQRGVWQPLHLLLSPERGADERVTGLHGVLARAELEEENSRELLSVRMAVEAASDGVGLADNSGRHFYSNRAFREMLGYRVPEFVAAGGLRALFDSPDAYQSVMSRVAEDGSWFGEVGLRTRLGIELPALLRVDGVRDADGQPQGLVYVITDMSERRQALAERHSMQSQLAHYQKMEAVGSLAGGIAHDFNNILHAINGYAQLLLRSPEMEPSLRSFVQDIQEVAARGKELVSGLMTFSRRVEPQRTHLDLNHLLREALRVLERTIPKWVAIDLDLEPDLWGVDADPNQLEQVLMNLATNARDAIEEAGSLRIQTRNVILDRDFCSRHPDLKAGAFVRLRVSDTGSGMPAEVTEHIFEPFFTTKPKGRGTGLGLATSYGMVQAHGGVITCHSRPGEGATFDIYLPCDAVAAPAATRGAAAVERVAPARLEGHETILLVDDERPIREAAQRMLKPFGYRLLTAASGEEALAVYAERGREIDMVLLDMGMPGMGGLRCLEELIKLDPVVKVIIATGYGSGGRVGQALAAGARDYLGKPYQLEDLLARVRQLFD